MGADPDGDRGLRHSAPTYISRDTRDLRSNGHRGLAPRKAFPPFSMNARGTPRGSSERLKETAEQRWWGRARLRYSPWSGPGEALNISRIGGTYADCFSR